MNCISYSVDVPDSSVQRPEVPSSVAIQGKTGSGGSSQFTVNLEQNLMNQRTVVLNVYQ